MPIIFQQNIHEQGKILEQIHQLSETVQRWPNEFSLDRSAKEEELSLLEKRISFIEEQSKVIVVKLEAKSIEEEKEKKSLEDLEEILIETDLKVKAAKRQLQNVKNFKHLQESASNIKVILTIKLNRKEIYIFNKIVNIRIVSMARFLCFRTGLSNLQSIFHTLTYFAHLHLFRTL